MNNVLCDDKSIISKCVAQVTFTCSPPSATSITTRSDASDGHVGPMSDSSDDEEATVCHDYQSIDVGMDDLTLGTGSGDKTAVQLYHPSMHNCRTKTICQIEFLAWRMFYVVFVYRIISNSCFTTPRTLKMPTS